MYFRGYGHEGVHPPRGDAWELRVYLGADPVTGKQRYSTRTVRAGTREAQRVLNEMITGAAWPSLQHHSRERENENARSWGHQKCGLDDAEL